MKKPAPRARRSTVMSELAEQRRTLSALITQVGLAMETLSLMRVMSGVWRG